MTYEEAKAQQKRLEELNKIDSDKLKEFDKHKNTIGMTPDHIRAKPEWQAAKKAFNQSFGELRNFNGWFVKQFKKEIAADRRNRYPNKLETIN